MAKKINNLKKQENGWKDFFKITKRKLAWIVIIFIILEIIFYFIIINSTISACAQCICQVGDVNCNCPRCPTSQEIALPFIFGSIIPDIILSYIITSVLFHYKSLKEKNEK